MPPVRVNVYDLCNDRPPVLPTARPAIVYRTGPPLLRRSRSRRRMDSPLFFPLVFVPPLNNRRKYYPSSKIPSTCIYNSTNIYTRSVTDRSVRNTNLAQSGRIFHFENNTIVIQISQLNNKISRRTLRKQTGGVASDYNGMNTRKKKKKYVVTNILQRLRLNYMISVWSITLFSAVYNRVNTDDCA